MDTKGCMEWSLGEQGAVHLWLSDGIVDGSSQVAVDGLSESVLDTSVQGAHNAL